MLKIKRIYDPPAEDDGYRVLIDRLWPRGMSKADAHLDLWLRDIAPSSALRKWYNHDPEKWTDFRKKYFTELDEKTELLDPILHHHRAGTVTLLFSSRETQLNNAHALKEYLEGME